jgi:hypothetical protein
MLEAEQGFLVMRHRYGNDDLIEQAQRAAHHIGVA